jgi:hypothetical protein
MELGVGGALGYYHEGVRVSLRHLNPSIALSAVVWSSIVAEVVGITLKVYEYH